MFKRLSFYLAIIGVIAAVVLVRKVRHVDPPPAPLKEPTHAPFANSIGARGIVESLDENVRIAPTVAGRIEKVFVKVGDRVQKGDPLFQIDSRNAESELRMQEAQILVLEARVQEAKTLVADRLDQFERAKKLRQKNVASEDETRREEFAYEAAQRQQTRALTELGFGNFQLANARVKLDLLTVRAPRDGTVLQVNTREGEYASATPSEILLLLGDVGTFQLRADVDEDNAGLVREGCPAIAYVKGRRDKPIPLRFQRIEPYVVPKKSLTGESSERVDTRVLQIIFRFDRPAVPIYVGQQMDVFLDGGPTPPPAQP